MSDTAEAIAQARKAVEPDKPKHVLRTLGHSIREYKKASILAPVFVTVEGILEILIPTIMASLIDEGITGGSMPATVKFGVILLVCAMVSLGAGFLSGKYAAVAGAGFAKNLRKDQFEKVQGFSFTNIDRFSTGSIVTRLTTDVTNLQNAYMMIIRLGVRAPIMVVVSWLFSFRISPSISMVFLACIPILAIGLCGLAVLVHPVFERVFHTYDALNNVVDENLQGIRVVKSFVREEHEDEKFGKISENIYQDFSKAEKTVAFNMPLMQLCVYTVMLLIAWFGARMIVASGNNAAVGMTTGELMSLISYAMQILMSLMMVSMVFVMLSISRASEERIAEVLEEVPDIQNPENPVREVKDGSIRFENVGFSYSGDPERLCLRGANLDIQPGEVVGILGGTGSAKSTLVQLIPRLYDATEGTVRVGGRDVREYDLAALRDAVAMVLQKNVLFSGTIRDNLRWGDPDADDETLMAACRAACADEFIERMPKGLDTDLGQGGVNVSGGQKQRLCIARALLKNPRVLIFDDSTSAVDTATEAKIRSALAALRGVTKIVIAQRISSVMNTDKIVILEDGRIHAVGTHAELLASDPIYQEIYASQMRGGEADGQTAQQ